MRRIIVSHGATPKHARFVAPTLPRNVAPVAPGTSKITGCPNLGDAGQQRGNKARRKLHETASPLHTRPTRKADAKQDLTDRTIRALHAAPEGTRYDVMDTQAPGLAIRVTDNGQRTFVLIARFPGHKQPTRRALGQYMPLNDAEEKRRYKELPEADRKKETFEAYLVRTYGASTLAGAREKARKWRAMIQSGIDPQTQEERQRNAAVRQQRNTFATVAEEFIKDKLPGERKGREVERDIRREFIPAWGKRPIAEIAPHDVRDVVKAAKDRGAPYQAHNLLTTARRLFSWAIDQQVYGLEILTMRAAEAEGDHR